MKNKLFIQDLFKSYKSIGSSVDVEWKHLPEKIKPFKDQIKKYNRRIGSFDIINSNNTPQNLENIYRDYQEYWNEHKTIKELSFKKIKELIYILFPNPNEGIKKGLYDNHEQFHDYLDILIKKNKPSYLKRLISELLYHYPKNEDLLFKRLDKIYSHLDKNKTSNQPLFKANKKFKLIEKIGPSLIADDIFKNTNLDVVLQNIWIKERHLLNGIGSKIVNCLCKLVKQPIANEDKIILNRFLEYLLGKNKVTYNDMISTIRYNDITPIVKVLLNPFEYTRPQELIKTKITKFLDNNIGDPRFQSEKWISMPKQKSIFLRWKVGETIENFLELVSYTSKKKPDSERMWKYRKQFIESYLNEGHIKEAWIILGKSANKDKSKFLKKDFNDYGVITKGATDPIHSVLLLKIGGLTISEWNFNGCVRVWTEGNEYAPSLYKKEYSRENLIEKSNKVIRHHGTETFYWQKELSKYIYRYADILLPKVY